MEVGSIPLLPLSLFWLNMVLFIRFLIHIHPNRMVLLKENTGTSLKPQSPYYLKLLCPLLFGHMLFLLLFSWLTSFLLQFLTLFLPGLSCFLPPQTYPNLRSLAVPAILTLDLILVISLIIEPRNAFS